MKESLAEQHLCPPKSNMSPKSTPAEEFLLEVICQTAWLGRFFGEKISAGFFPHQTMPYSYPLLYNPLLFKLFLCPLLSCISPLRGKYREKISHGL